MKKQLVVSSPELPNTPYEASIEDLVAKQLNRFKGWTCSAGVESLYIDYDRKVWVGNCAGASQKTIDPNKAWGFLGTIDTQIDLPTKTVTCPYSECGCGADIVVSKYENNPTFLFEHDTHETDPNAFPIESITTINSVKTNYKLGYQVLWDVGRRCNYDCSYCWSDIHNTTDPHVDINTFTKTADYLIDNWSKGNEIRWYFGGGEPTLNDDFEPFVQHLAARNQWVMLVSNGSQGPKYWRTNAGNYNTLIFSAHFEFMKRSLFISNYQAVLNQMVDGKRPDNFIVKLMTKPGQVQNSLEFINEIKDNCKINSLNQSIKSRLSFDVVPLRGSNGTTVIQYSQEDMKQILAANQA